MDEEFIEKRRARNRTYAQTRYDERRSWIDSIKLDAGCIDCGYADHPAALQFDHRDEATKSFKIASSLMRKKEAIEEELAKCDVRCGNCHAVKTVNSGVLNTLPKRIGPTSYRAGHTTKFADDLIVEIVNRYRLGETATSLAEEYNVSASTIYEVHKERTRVHLSSRLVTPEEGSIR